MGGLFCGLQWASIAQSRTSSWPPRNIGRWWQGYARKTVNCSCFGYYTPSWLCCHSYCLGCGEVRESKSCCCLPDSHSEKITIQEMLNVAPLVEQHRILFFFLLLRLLLSCIVTAFLVPPSEGIDDQLLELDIVLVANGTFILFTGRSLSRAL